MRRGRLAAFLQLRPGPVQLRRAIEMSSFVELAAQEQRAGFVERPETAERFFGPPVPGSGAKP